MRGLAMEFSQLISSEIGTMNFYKINREARLVRKAPMASDRLKVYYNRKKF